MPKNKEMHGRCELCGIKDKVSRVRRKGHLWFLCKICREDKGTDKRISVVKEFGKAIDGKPMSEIEKASEMFKITREEETGTKRAIKEQIEEIDSIIKLVQDLRSDAMTIVERYVNMLNELDEMRKKLLA